MAPAAVAQVPPPKEGWSKPERWVWGRISAGQIANFNALDGEEPGGEELDPKTPDGWDEGRKLSPGFLKEILLREPYRSAIPVEGVRIIGGWFPEPVDLAHGRSDRQLWLDRCRFERPANLSHLHVGRVLSLEGSVFAGQNDELVSVNLLQTKVDGQLVMAGVTVAGTLNMNSLDVGQSLFMRDVFKDVVLLGARVGGQLDMDGATVAETLNMDSLDVGQNLFMRDAVFKDVVLLSARVGGQPCPARPSRKRWIWRLSTSGSTCSCATPPLRTWSSGELG
jgi:hypothetical protein